ncbi:hypothetical protein BD626DRAFT_478458 [Schizophyllum amplum]|uniref:Uncharacterized protein n=1 Tax=Schizophyllum amplum TaxID=97359 RepID=A0A550CRD9_9AGAR|nr:hypothetical protein BD626DRAFT_478458 [Auriculariopsis ampla]
MKLTNPHPHAHPRSEVNVQNNDRRCIVMAMLSASHPAVAIAQRRGASTTTTSLTTRKKRG